MTGFAAPFCIDNKATMIFTIINDATLKNQCRHKADSYLERDIFTPRRIVAYAVLITVHGNISHFIKIKYQLETIIYVHVTYDGQFVVF